MWLGPDRKSPNRGRKDALSWRSRGRKSMLGGWTNRRAFIAGVGSAAAWPVVVRAQQSDQARRVGVFMNYVESDPAGQLRATAFRQELEKHGWVVGRNLQIDYQWGIGDADFIRSAV